LALNLADDVSYRHLRSLNECPDGVPGHRTVDIPVLIKIEHTNREVVYHAERKSGGVHDAEALLDGLHRGELGHAFGVGVCSRVSRINTIHLRALEQHVRAYFDRPEGRPRIRRKIGIARTTRKNHDPSL